MAACRITKAPQGSAVFETVSEEQFSGKVVERMTPPRGYNAVSTSGLLAYELDGNKHQIPFAFGDLQVLLQPCYKRLSEGRFVFRVFPWSWHYMLASKSALTTHSSDAKLL